MTIATRIDRESFITEALRAVDATLGDQPPTAQALAIIAALKRLRSATPVRVDMLQPTDYLERLQIAARAAWSEAHDFTDSGVEFDAIAAIDTPVGRFKAVTWRRAKGDKFAWWTEYYLNDEPITMAEIKKAGLAQRPHTRNRQRKDATK